MRTTQKQNENETVVRGKANLALLCAGRFDDEEGSN